MADIYTFLAHKANEGGYWAECLELPGCVVQGETLEELKRNIWEALEAMLEEEVPTPVALSSPGYPVIIRTWSGITLPWAEWLAGKELPKTAFEGVSNSPEKD